MADIQQEAQNKLAQVKAGADALKGAASQAKSIYDAITQTLDLFFGGDSKNQKEGKQQSLLPTLPTIPAPPTIPTPTVPPELAAKAAKAKALGALIQPILQMLQSLLSLLNGKNVAQIANALSKAGDGMGGLTQTQGRQLQAALQAGAAQALIDTGNPMPAGVIDFATLPQAAVDNLLRQPIGEIEGLTDPVKPPVDTEPPEDRPTIGHVLEEVGKALGLVPIVVDKPKAVVPGMFGLDFTPEQGRPSGFPSHTFDPDPPTLDYVVNPTRTPITPLAPGSSPAEQLNRAKGLMSDLGNLTAQRAALADQTQDLGEAIDLQARGDFRGSLWRSLLTILRMVALFNLQGGESLSADSASAALLKQKLTGDAPSTALDLTPSTTVAAFRDAVGDPLVNVALASLDTERWEDHAQLGPLADDVQVVQELVQNELHLYMVDGDFHMTALGDPVVKELVVDHEDFLPLEPFQLKVTHAGAIAAWDQALDALPGANEGIGAFPGNLVYAAVGDHPENFGLYTPVLLSFIYPEDSVLPQLVPLIGRNMGHPAGIYNRLGAIVGELGRDDEELRGIPDLLLGLEPRTLLYRKTMLAFVDFLEALWAQPSLAQTLRPLETQISSAGLALAIAVQASTLNRTNLKERVRMVRLTGLENEELSRLARAWDQAAGSTQLLNVGSTQAAAFLALVKGVPLPANDLTLEETATLYRFEVEKIGLGLGNDLLLAAGVAGALWRSILLLRATEIPDEKASSRLKAILSIADEWYKQIDPLPNKDSLERIKKVLV